MDTHSIQLCDNCQFSSGLSSHRRDRPSGLAEGARFDLALDGDNKPRGHLCRLALGEKPQLVQGFDCGMKLFSLDFGDLAELPLICGLVGPDDGKAFDRLPGHLLVDDAEPMCDQPVPCRGIEPLNSVARPPTTIFLDADENDAIAIQIDD